MQEFENALFSVTFGLCGRILLNALHSFSFSFFSLDEYSRFRIFCNILTFSNCLWMVFFFFFFLVKVYKCSNVSNQHHFSLISSCRRHVQYGFFVAIVLLPMERLGIVVYNGYWRFQFPKTSVIHLPALKLDSKLIISVLNVEANLDEGRQDVIWCQNSRELWLEEGDKNSKFFHRSTIIRRCQNKIYRTKWNDGNQSLLENFRKGCEASTAQQSTNFERLIQPQ